MSMLDSSSCNVHRTKSLTTKNLTKINSKECGTRYKETNFSQWKLELNVSPRISNRETTVTWNSSTEAITGTGSSNTPESVGNFKIAQPDHQLLILAKQPWTSSNLADEATGNCSAQITTDMLSCTAAAAKWTTWCTPSTSPSWAVTRLSPMPKWKRSAASLRQQFQIMICPTAIWSQRYKAILANMTQMNSMSESLYRISQM